MAKPGGRGSDPAAERAIPIIFLDARYEKVRIDSVIQRHAVLIAMVSTGKCGAGRNLNTVMALVLPWSGSSRKPPDYHDRA